MATYAGSAFSLATSQLPAGANPSITHGFSQGPTPGPSANPLITKALTKGILYGLWYLGHSTFSSSEIKVKETPAVVTVASRISQRLTKSQTPPQTPNPLISSCITEGTAAILTANPIISAVIGKGILGNTFTGLERKLSKGGPVLLIFNPLISPLLAKAAFGNTFTAAADLLKRSKLPSQIPNAIIRSTITEGNPPSILIISNPLINALLSKGTFGNTFTAVADLLKRSKLPLQTPNALILSQFLKGTTPGPAANALINSAIGKGSMSNLFTSRIESILKSNAPGQIPNPLISSVFMKSVAPVQIPNPLIGHNLSIASLGRVFTAMTRQLMESKLPTTITNPLISHAIMSTYWRSLPASRTKVYVYYGNNAALPKSDWSKVDPDLPELSGLLGSLEIQHLTSGSLLVEHPAIKRIEFYDKNNTLVAQIDNLSDFSAGRIIKRVKQDLNLQAAISYIKVITAANKTQTFYI